MDPFAFLAEAYEVPPTIVEAQERAVAASVANAPKVCPTLIAYAEDVIERRSDRDRGGPPADDERQLDLIVRLAGHRGDGHGLAVAGERVV